MYTLSNNNIIIIKILCHFIEYYTKVNDISCCQGQIFLKCVFYCFCIFVFLMDFTLYLLHVNNIAHLGCLCIAIVFDSFSHRFIIVCIPFYCFSIVFHAFPLFPMLFNTANCKNTRNAMVFNEFTMGFRNLTGFDLNLNCERGISTHRVPQISSGSNKNLKNERFRKCT